MILQISVIFFVIIFSLSIWYLALIPEYEKLSDSYTFNQEYVGQNQIVNDVYGNLSEPFLLRDALSQDIIEKNGDILTIFSVVSSKKAETDEQLFYVENTYKVDAKTRMHIDREGKLFSFPPGVEKKDYDFFHPAVFLDDPMKFKETGVINGLNVYTFEVVSKGADVSFAFQQFAPHQIFTDTTSRLHVEPITGNVIRFEKNWENYLVENGEKINTVEIGGKETSKYTESILADTTVAQIENIYFHHVLMPVFIGTVILVIGIIWVLFSYLNTMKYEKIQMREKEKLKDELVSMITHEIRNPLTPIKALCDLLLLGRDGTLNEKQRQKIQEIIKHTNSLAGLLSDFSEVKKLELNQIRLSKTKFDLKEYLENAVASIRPFTDEKNIQLRLELEETWTVICDQKRISQVISNLVKNAIDFVPEDKGLITISAKHDDSGTVISVQDNGIGIPESATEIIFEKFQQLDVPPHIHREGSGLGLSVCKGIVEAHGGKIWVDQKYHEGAKFQFLIPNSE